MRYRFHVPASVRVVVALGLAGVASIAVALSIPAQLHVSSDVVGFPTYANFNIVRLMDLYYIGFVLFPILAFALYLGETWLGRRLGLVQIRAEDTSPPAGEVAAEVGGRVHAIVVAASRTLLVGISYGLVTAIGANAAGPRFWLVVALVAFLYADLLGVLTWLLGRRLAVDFEVTRARCNALAAPLALLGMWVVSATQTITVLSDGSVHHYEWMPWWLALLLTAAALGWIWSRLRAASTADAVKAVERKTLVFLTAPLMLFFFSGALPGALGRLDTFHEGEFLVGAHMVMAGAMYWRDLLSTHGVLQDVLAPIFNLHLIQDSRWGYWAGDSMVIKPLTYVFFFVFGAWLFERSWAFVAALLIAILSYEFFPLDTRFVAWPLILLLLGASLVRGKWWISAALGGSLAAQAILVPESAYCVPACGLIVLLYDFVHRRPGQNLVTMFSRTLATAGGGILVLALLCLYLLTQHALGAFIFYYQIFIPGHDLFGGLNVHLRAYGPLFVIFVIAPLVAFLLSFFYFAKAVVTRRPLDIRAWVIAAALLFAVPYYTKYVGRADLGHGDQAYSASIPVIMFVVYRTVAALDRGISPSWLGGKVKRLVTQPLALIVLLETILIVATPSVIHLGPPLLVAVSDSPERYHRTVLTEPQLPRLGYEEGAIDHATVNDMKSIFDAYLQQPGDWVFDFSNEPALVYYLTDHYPKTRYYHVTMAATERAQKDLVSELQRNPPKLVVFTGMTFGLLNWDGIPNMVRHYDVGQYILDNYTPLLSTHTNIIYGRTADHLSPAKAQALPLSQPVDTEALAFKGFSCDWGYIPNFLHISPPPPVHTASPVSLTMTPDPLASVTFEGWAGDEAARAAARAVIVTLDGREIGRVGPVLPRPDVARLTGMPGLFLTGFRITVTVPEQVVGGGMRSMGVYAVTADGTVMVLAGSPGTASEIVFAGGGKAPVRGGLAFGNLDITTAYHQLVVTLPPGAAWSDYRWLEIDTPTRLVDDRWALYQNPAAEPGGQVIFRTLPGTAAGYRVLMGSCAQWHAFQPGRLILGHGRPQDISAIRLLP
jgi:hypothetical protein